MLTKSNYRWIFRLLSFTLLVIVIALSLMPSVPDTPEMVDDKIQHFVAYAAVTFCFIQWSTSFSRRVCWVLLILATSIIIEYLQPFFGRQFDYDDMTANGIGIFIGFCGGWIFYTLKSRFLISDESE